MEKIALQAASVYVGRMFYQIKESKWASIAAGMEEMRNAYKSLLGKREVKGPPGGLRRTWDDNIKMSTKEIGYEDVEGTRGTDAYMG
jgi:hypothetical protein